MQDIMLSEVKNEETQGKHLIFSICDVHYGIEIEYVTEIISVQPITPVPNTPCYVKGITNIRGTIVPVVDMRARFKLEEVPYDERTCIVLLSKENVNIGLIVDAVADVISFSADDLLPLPTGSTTDKNKFLKGIGKCDGEVKQIIDISKIFDT
ncbi:MAG: chemotaxis protein CheW [Oscillospiraceae bacterium]